MPTPMPRYLVQLIAVCLAVLTLVSAKAATTEELLRMTEQLDQLDKLDFDAAIEKANKCTRLRDFTCSESQLKGARKLATGNASKSALRQAENNLVAEREALENERRVFAQRQRELREAEERLKESEERAQRQAAREQEDTGMTTGQGIALFGQLLGQSLANQSALRMAQQQANTRRFDEQRASVQANIAADQRRFAEERARLEAQRANLQREQIQQQQRQLVAQAEVRQSQQLQAASQQQQAQAMQQREQEAAAQRAQNLERQENERRLQANLAREREKLAQEARDREAKAREAEREKREEERRLAAAAEKAEKERALANRPDALAFCWETSRGNSWICDGKGQNTDIAYKDQDEALSLSGCKQPQRLVNTTITLTSLRVASWNQKTGWLYRCGDKIDSGPSGHVTWNRDIRQFWRGINF